MAKEERTEDLNPHDDDIEEKIRQMLDPRIPDEGLATGDQPVSSIKIVSEHKEIKSSSKKQEVPSETAPELPEEPENTDKGKKKDEPKQKAKDASKEDSETKDKPKEKEEPSEDVKPKEPEAKEDTEAKEENEADESSAEPLPPSARRSHKVITPISEDVKSEDEQQSEKKEDDKPVDDEPVEDDEDKDSGDTPELKESDNKSTKISVVHDDEQPETDTKEPVKISVEDHGDSSDDVAEKLDEAISGLGDDDQETKESETSEEESKEVEEKKAEEKEEPTTKKQSPKATEKTKKETDAKPKKSAKEKKPIKVSVVDEPETDKAVKEIERAETDKLLELEDKVRKQSVPKQKKPKKSKHYVSRFFKSKGLKMFIVALLLAGLLTAIAIPKYRYLILNELGVRVSSSLTVRDTTTGQPIKGATVMLAGQQAETDENGHVELNGLVQGKTTLIIERIAFATHEENLTLGWGSNPLGDRELAPNGIQYEISVVDYLSGKGIEGAQASSGDSSARSNDKGEIKLTIPDTKETDIKITISAPGYRSEEVRVAFDTTKLPVQKLVAERKHVFVDDSSGRYNIFSMYIDGKDKKMVLKASGYEKEDLVLLPHPTVNRVAYVSTRANKFDEYAKQKYSLLILDTNENSSVHVVTERQIRLLGWSGSHLLYIETGGEDETPNRSRLMTYNYLTNEAKEISKTNYFNDVLLAGDKIYFAPTGLSGDGEKAEFFMANADGANKKSLFEGEIWKIFRNNYTDLALSAQELWYRHVIGSNKVENLDNVPNNRTNRIYLDGPDNGKSAWIDDNAGEPVLKLYDKRAKVDEEVVSKNGMTYPISWLDSKTLVFRVENSSETADYAVNIEGGEVVKITNVAETGSSDNWYFY